MHGTDWHYVVLMLRRAPESTRTDTLVPYATLIRSVRSSSSSARTWRDSGTLWVRSIFLFSPGMVQIAASRSNSHHSAERSSPGLTNTCGAIRNAIPTVADLHTRRWRGAMQTTRTV